MEPTPARELAFKSLIRTAIETVGDINYNPAVSFFSSPDNALVKVAANELDFLFGAAATLTDEGRRPKPQVLKAQETTFDALHEQTVNAAVDRLQASLVQWVFMVSSFEGLQGVQRVLSLFDSTPETELQFRSNFVAKLSSLITSTETMNAVLPYLYNALTNREPIIRGAAAVTIGDADFDIQRDFPDLIYELYLALLLDPNIYVHQSAVRSLRTYCFPDHLRLRLKSALYALIVTYHSETHRADFLAVCLDELANGFLVSSEVEGRWGEMVVSAIEGMPTFAALLAIERMPLSMGKAPGYPALVASLLKSEEAKGYAQGKLLRALFHVPEKALSDCVGSIVDAYTDANPWELRVPLALLSRAKAFKDAADLCNAAINLLPNTTEHQASLLYLQTVKIICDFEAALPTSENTLNKARLDWTNQLQLLKLEEEMASARRGIPPSIFREA